MLYNFFQGWLFNFNIILKTSFKNLFRKNCEKKVILLFWISHSNPTNYLKKRVSLRDVCECILNIIYLKYIWKYFLHLYFMPFLYNNVSPLLFSVGASARFPLMEGMGKSTTSLKFTHSHPIWKNPPSSRLPPLPSGKCLFFTHQIIIPPNK